MHTLNQQQLAAIISHDKSRAFLSIMLQQYLAVLFSWNHQISARKGVKLVISVFAQNGTFSAEMVGCTVGFFSFWGFLFLTGNPRNNIQNLNK